MNAAPSNDPQLSGILFGAAYYPEYEPDRDFEADLDLMAAAGFTVVRVGESVWSTWEPTDGSFDLDWLRPVLDAAHTRGIRVILGTPTYAVPPWLQKKHPEIVGDAGTGQPLHWGGRQEVDHSNPTFRRYAERVIRAILESYAGHPAVIGFQVDNEPGVHLFHNAGVFARFVDTLKERYGDVETINREWGLTYWSHRLSDWSELWTPDGNTLPQYDLAWRAFQADLTTEFIAWQADIVREYSAADQFVTTCQQYERPAAHDAQLAAILDLNATNPYYGMQDRLAWGADLPALSYWTSTGVWGLMLQGDRGWSSKQSRFLVTETNAQSIGDSEMNYPPYPGQLRLSALALVSRGAAMVEYWHWQALRYGTETFWGGVLPHSGKPGRIYREVSELGALLGELGTALDGYTPEFDVAILYSNESKWALDFMPPFRPTSDDPERAAYRRIFETFYRGIIESGAQARVIHSMQLGEDAAAFAATHPVLVVPAFYVSTDDELAFLRDYAEAGGHLVVGMRTGYADHEARARAAFAPAMLSDVAGVGYDEFSNLDSELTLRSHDAFAFAISDDARATTWADGLEVDGADVIAQYEHPEFGRFPAITTRAVGAGRITIVGTLPNPALAADIARWIAPATAAGDWRRSETVTVASGSTAAGSRVIFLSNWSSGQATVVAPSRVRDARTGEAFAAGHEFSLQPWASTVLIGE